MRNEQRSIIIGATATLLLLSLLLMVFCHHRVPSDERKIRRIAETEALQRGWKSAKVVDIYLKGDVWWVLLELRPRSFSSWACIDISKDGEVLEYLGGL